jgi:hypothetical protein
MNWSKKIVSFVLILAFGLVVFVLPQGRLVLATEYISPSFKILDPVLDTGGIANSTSSSFLQLGAQGQVGIGYSDSGNFILKSGFLYFGAPEEPGGEEPEEPTQGGVVLPFPFSPYPPHEIFLRILRPEEPRPSCVDLNDDGFVELTDASIMFFNWFPDEALLAGLGLKNDRPDCNEDGLVDILDFSILLYWWNGG